jgi:hypothetical protein
MKPATPMSADTFLYCVFAAPFEIPWGGFFAISARCTAKIADVQDAARVILLTAPRF